MIPPLDQSCAYDPMGNRRTYADQAGSTAYTANNANQYTAVGGVTSVYDRNGNLLTDGVKNYTWDAENQLTSVTPVNPTEGSVKVEYTYDWRMRRTGKRSYVYTAGNWTLTKSSDFKYHEWNPIQETITPASGSTENKYYVWGNDLSGSLHGAGGVCGLLSMKYDSGSYFYAYDGNGNVRALVKADAANPAASGVTARYAYDGFGKEVAASDVDADKNTFCFSTKYTDTESNLIYYGNRYYNPQGGRWESREPLGEIASFNIYSFIENNAPNDVDLIGLLSIKKIPGISNCLGYAATGDEGNNYQINPNEDPKENFIDQMKKDGWSCSEVDLASQCKCKCDEEDTLLGMVYTKGPNAKSSKGSPWSSPDFPWGTTDDDAYDYHFIRRPAGNCKIPPQFGWYEVPGFGKVSRPTSWKKSGFIDNKITGTKYLCCCKKRRLNKMKEKAIKLAIKIILSLAVSACSTLKQENHQRSAVLYLCDKWIIEGKTLVSPQFDGGSFFLIEDVLSQAEQRGIHCDIIPVGDCSISESIIIESIKKHPNNKLITGGRYFIKINHPDAIKMFGEIASKPRYYHDLIYNNSSIHKPTNNGTFDAKTEK